MKLFSFSNLFIQIRYIGHLIEWLFVSLSFVSLHLLQNDADLSTSLPATSDYTLFTRSWHTQYAVSCLLMPCFLFYIMNPPLVLFLVKSQIFSDIYLFGCSYEHFCLYIYGLSCLFLSIFFLFIFSLFSFTFTIFLFYLLFFFIFFFSLSSFTSIFLYFYLLSFNSFCSFPFFIVLLFLSTSLSSQIALYSAHFLLYLSFPPLYFHILDNKTSLPSSLLSPYRYYTLY